MKKVINITIGTVVFSIEDDAYEKLSRYIDSIRNHFGTNEEGSEIVEDIEHGIAEKFQARSKSDTPISLVDVEQVIKEMGTVHDFKNFDGEEEGSEQTRNASAGVKRLYRDEDNGIIAGVSAGIAAFFGIDPVIVRIIFVLLVFLNGFGILAYLVLWLIMPKAVTTTQKLEMQGEMVTLKKISEFVEENVEKIKKKDTVEVEKTGRVKATRNAFMRFNRSFLGGLGSLIRILLGVIFIGIGIGGIVALTIGSFGILVILPVTSPDPAAQIVIETLVGGHASPALIVAAYFFIFIPFVSLFLAGIGILKRKNVVGMPLSVLMTVLWLLALMILLIFGAQNAPVLQEKMKEFEYKTGETTIEEDMVELDLLMDEFDTQTIE